MVNLSLDFLMFISANMLSFLLNDWMVGLLSVVIPFIREFETQGKIDSSVVREYSAKSILTIRVVSKPRIKELASSIK